MFNESVFEEIDKIVFKLERSVYTTPWGDGTFRRFNFGARNRPLRGAVGRGAAGRTEGGPDDSCFSIFFLKPLHIPRYFVSWRYRVL